MRIGLRVGPQILLNVAIESDAHRCLEARQAIAGQWLSDHEIGRHELFEIQLHGVHCRNAGIAPKRKEADVVPGCVQNRRHVAPPEGSASKQLATQTHIARDVVHLHSMGSPSELDGAILEEEELLFSRDDGTTKEGYFVVPQNLLERVQLEEDEP